MNCVLHFLEKEEDISNLHNNYDLLSSSIKDQFVISFVPSVMPQRQFIQYFCKKYKCDDKQYENYFFIYQINKFLQSKGYKRLIFINSNLQLKKQNNLIELLQEINAFGPDFIKFNTQGKICENIFLARISVLDNNLDYANCKYDVYSSREKYNNFEVYINSPFSKTINIEDYI